MTPSYAYLKTKLHFWISENRIDKWANQMDFIFILAIGRSGTAFLASLLNRAENIRVAHEPVPDDFRAHIQAFYDPKEAKNYFVNFRKKEIYIRMHQFPTQYYGEVNSVLRRHAEAICQTFPKATLIHLIRDGRDVVRSMMSRKTMTPQDPISTSIHPIGDDPWLKNWDDMDRFARLCWYWQVENTYLRTTIRRTVQFEKILSSYNYFDENILEPCNIRLSKDAWLKMISFPKNATKVYQMPHWSDWTRKQKNSFNDICGEEMRKSGYDL